MLGGGLVPGSVVLLAGEPGVGKSTLLLEVARRFAAPGGRPALIVTGEESTAQVRLRAERTGALHADLYLAAENDLGAVLTHVDQVEPGLLVVDSVQTISTTAVDSAAGGVPQIRAVAVGADRAWPSSAGIATVLVGHVTKDGSIAGPRVLEHLVDVVLHFEGDRHSSLRLIRATKNRYGAVDEIGCFEMREDGIVGLADPSGLFLSDRADGGARHLRHGRRSKAGGRWSPRSRRWSAADPAAARRGGRSAGSTAPGWRCCSPCSPATRGLPWPTTTSTPRPSAALPRPSRPPTSRSRWRSRPRAREVAAPADAVRDRRGVAVRRRPAACPALDRRLAEAARLGFTTALVPGGTTSATPMRPEVPVATIDAALGRRSHDCADRPR